MAEAAAPHDELLGATIAGRYWIISRLGAGGMGVAYRAWDGFGGVPVVIKIPKRAFLEDPKFTERFYREIRLLQGLAHPHVVPIVDVGEHDRMPYIVLRFLPGGSLSNRRLRDEQGKPTANPAGMLHLWLPAVAAALDHVHAQGVVHRDVKPANIFFDAFWGAYLGDFGIAKIVEESDVFDKEQTLTATHMGIGTPEYMSPEQFTPKAVVDGRADQYALAVTVYDMLAGHKPFMGKKAHLIVEVTTQAPPPLEARRPDLPASLIAAVSKGLAKKPTSRFESCAAFVAAVLQNVPVLEDEPGVARLLCPHCSNILKLPVTAAGQNGKCPRCRSKMKVAEDLGALWLLEEDRAPEQPGHEAMVPPAVPPAVPGESLPGDDAGSDGGDLPEFKPVSSTTPIGRSIRKQRRISPFAILCCTAAAVVVGGFVAVIEADRGQPSAGEESSAAGVQATAGPIRKNEPSAKDEGPLAASVPAVAPVEERVPDAAPVPVVELPPAAKAPPAVTTGDPIRAATDAQTAATDPLKPENLPAVSPLDALMKPEPEPKEPSTSGRKKKSRSKRSLFDDRRNAKERAAQKGGGVDTEQAVERALQWLAAHQLPDGGWSFDFDACPSCAGRCSHSGEGHRDDRCAATGLALLPFLGHGYTHRQGPYRKVVERGLVFLATPAMSARGKLYDKGTMYSQGVAAIALAEAYGMTRDQRLAVPAQLAVNFIMDAQDPRGGGWRYSPRQQGDTSASGWQLMALSSAHAAKLQVNPVTITKVTAFLDSMQSADGAMYGYTDSGKSPATTAVGLLCRMHLGWDRNHPALQRGVEYLTTNGPSTDLYYDYYATHVMYQYGADPWVQWNNSMKPLLLETQSRVGHQAGSFFDGVDGGYSAKPAGRLYCTVMATLILEVYYRHTLLSE